MKKIFNTQKLKIVRHQADVLANILEKDSFSKDYKDTLQSIYEEKLLQANELYKKEKVNIDNPQLKIKWRGI